MENPFDSQDMAEGYAHWRPPLHQPIIDKIHSFLSLDHLCSTALDVGCGTGRSTGVLKSISRRQIGIEPSFSMLKWSKSISENADFVTGSAEDLPIASNSVDLITAAGSLNWIDLGCFFPEARRILKPNGLLVIYDFGPGREFPGSSILSEWFSSFQKRFPPPPCQEISPEILSEEAVGFHMRFHEDFQISLTLSSRFYLEYILTETNVAAAVRRGTDPEEIRNWCENTLKSVFQGNPREVIFRGFITYFN